MTLRLKILLLGLLLLVAIPWFAFTRLPGLAFPAEKKPPFRGPLDQAERIS